MCPFPEAGVPCVYLVCEDERLFADVLLCTCCFYFIKGGVGGGC